MIGTVGKIETALREAFNCEVIVRESAESTMDLARAFGTRSAISDRENRTVSDTTGIRHNGELGLNGVALALEQTAGRGRQGRQWSSSKGEGLYFTISYSFKLGIEQLTVLPLLVGDGLCRELRDFIPDLGLKWPNDLLVPSREFKKLGGILVESYSIGGVVSALIGIGINLRGDSPGVTLEEVAKPEPIATERLLVKLVRSVVEVCKQRESGLESSLIEEYRSYHLLQGRRIRFVGSQALEREGTVVDISTEGGLIVDTDGGRITLVSGDVHLTGWR